MGKGPKFHLAFIIVGEFNLKPGVNYYNSDRYVMFGAYWLCFDISFDYRQY